MVEYTLEWEADLGHEDIERFSRLQGVSGVSVYKNVLTLHYELPPASQHVRQLARSVTEMLLTGNGLVSTTIDSNEPDHVRDRMHDMLVH